jgi:hypothetical protein
LHLIKLEYYHRPDPGSSFTKNSFYRVWLPEREFRFQSKRATLKFLAELNKHLNGLAFDLNFICADVYSEFRVYFFHLSTVERNIIENRSAGASKLFGLLVTRSGSANGAAFTFDRFNHIVTAQLEILGILEGNSMNLINTVQRYKLENLKNRLEWVRGQLSVFPDHRP